MQFRHVSGIGWTICKQSASCFRQIATPTPHHSFLDQVLFLMSIQQCKSTEDSVAACIKYRYSVFCFSRWNSIMISSLSRLLWCALIEDSIVYTEQFKIYDGTSGNYWHQNASGFVAFACSLGHLITLFDVIHPISYKNFIHSLDWAFLCSSVELF